MARSLTLLLALTSLCCSASARAVGSSLTVPSYRQEADAETVAALRKRDTGTIASTLGKSLYWFGHFNVGDASDLRLLIDTGSTDLIVNPGLYKPSKNKKPYGTGNFSITYEGVNRAGFGFETINGTTQRDTVSMAGLTVKEQAVGESKTFKYFDVKQLPYPNQGQGIIGFGNSGSSSYTPPSDSWFGNLCHNGMLSECKFALLFGTSGKGLTVLGKLAKQYLKGSLTTVKATGEITVKGDVALNNKIILTNQTIIMDVGTDNIQGPLGATKKILQQLGYHPTVFTGTNKFDPAHPVKNVLGYFDCKNPPTLGFSFPTQSELGKGEKATLFNVSPDVWNVYKNSPGNCTSILGGTNALGSGADAAWLLGQPFFAGHYIQFDRETKTVGYGDLKDPSMKSCT